MLGLRCGWLWAADMAGQAATAANIAMVAKRFMRLPLFRSVDRAGRGVPRCGDDVGRALAFLRGRIFGRKTGSHPGSSPGQAFFLKMLYFASSGLSQFVALTFCRRSWSTYGMKVSRNERCSCRYSHRQLLARRSGSDFFTNANFTLSPP